MPDYIWPLGKRTAPDEMNTSFGPRIDMDRWDFHDGIDLPAPKGTPVHAMRGGRVYRAGKGGTDAFSSRHVVVKVEDPDEGTMYHVYLHLDSIHPSALVGATVSQGQRIGTVGDDDAIYSHLHMEIRRGTLKEMGSVHPLGFLPYPDTAGFSAPVEDRFNRLDGRMAARLLFTGASKLEGDLQRVEVDLLCGTRLLARRQVDFNDKGTIADSKGDEHRFTGGLAVEGYQKSNMIAHERSDLRYGIIVRSIPNKCDRLHARVIDASGNVATSAPIAVPARDATDEFVDFEDGQLPPPGWVVLSSGSGSGTSVTIDPAAAHCGSSGLLCIDDSFEEGSTQRAAIEYPLPSDRFEWRIEGWFKPEMLELAPHDSVYLLYLLSDQELSIAARIREVDGDFRPSLVARDSAGTLWASDPAAPIAPAAWRRWRLELLRLGTRETTAILSLNEGSRMVEQARLNWDSTGQEPERLRAGIGRSSAGATARVALDELWVSEGELPA